MTRTDLIAWYEELNCDLLACDPSADEYSLDQFHEIQLEFEELDKACLAAGTTLESIEDEAYA